MSDPSLRPQRSPQQVPQQAPQPSPLQALRSRRRLPLPLTTATLALLLLLPALALGRWPRPRAQGLEQLMASSSLLQSFPASPGRPVPALWRDRLGEARASRLWREQRRPWWQFWGSHAEGGAYLALQENAAGPAQALPPNGLRVGNLLVVAPDPLSRRLLQDQLRPDQRAGRGLYSTCLPRLESGQGVFWTAAGLGTLLGPVAPLFEAYQEGCLSLSLDGSALRWQGEASDRSATFLPPPSRPEPAGSASSLSPLPERLLLELQGSSLEQLFRGLLARQLIRDPLAARYGIDTRGLALLRRSPFRLRLLPQASGPFQASLELQVAVGADRRGWSQLLVGLGRSLQGQGLQDATGAPATALADPAAAERQSLEQRWRRQATWRRPDGVVLGGWRWLDPAGPSPQLLLFLGPPPQRRPGLAVAAEPQPAAGALWLRARPRQLATLGLLPEQLPELVRRADLLGMEAVGGKGLSRLTGELRVLR